MKVPQLTYFFNKIRQDNHITPSHISLYMALLERWNQNRFNSPVLFYRKDIMIMAKMNGTATYHKCIKDLQSLGYIEYYPSHNPAFPSEVYFFCD
jgi:replication initiation and membrane attachment protein DnaB